jgi:hypothetical protein
MISRPHGRTSAAFALAIGCAACLIACKKNVPIAPAPEVIAPPSGLPPVVHGSPLVPARFVVSVTSNDVSLSGVSIVPLPTSESWSRGVDAQYKKDGANGLMIMPLADALNRTAPDAGGGGDARVFIEGAIPYRLLIEVLFTLGQNKVATFRLVAPAAAGGALKEGTAVELDAYAPRPSDISMLKRQDLPPDLALALGRPRDAGALSPFASMPHEPRLYLTVIVVTDGFSIKAIGGNIAPGCKDTGPGLAVANGDGGVYKFAELEACLAKVRAASPDFKDEQDITLAASAAVPYATIVSTADAAMGQGFTKLAFGIPH